MQNESFGPYVLQELVGGGGMGEVFRAYDTRRKRTVALKRLPVVLARDEAFRERFRTESEIAARLHDPHVLPIHDFGQIDGRLFIDMRYVEGSDLGHLLGRRGALRPEQAVDVLAQVASALDAAHADGLVHRDVKPSNVLVTTADAAETPVFAYLTDFGVAQIGGADTALSTTNATAGTVDYMAPERFSRRRVDHRVDVYSLGCVLFEMLTGTRPFPAADMPAAMHAHVNEPPPRPSARTSSVPPALDEVVVRAMAKDPDRRYPSCGLMAADARARLVGAPPVAVVSPVAAVAPAFTGWPTQASPLAAPSVPPAPPSVPSAPPSRRRVSRPVLAGVAAAVVAAAATVAVVLPRSGETASASPPGASLAPAASAAPASVPGSAPGSATPVVASPAAATVADGAFTGRAGDGVTVALAFTGGRAAAYLCDGQRVESWLQGVVDGTHAELAGQNGATLSADLTADGASGTIVVGGRALPFRLDRSASPAGLYRARAGSRKIGWIVLGDGTRVGLADAGGVPEPAPPVDTTALTTVVDGRTVPVARITGIDPAWSQ